MLKHIRILLVIAFLLAAGGAGFLFYYKYTHEGLQAGSLPGPLRLRQC